MASNLRVLVSNLGDGNWGSGAGTENVLDRVNPSIYFPPAFNAAGNQVKGTAPSAGVAELAPGSLSVNGTWPLAGWSSKTHYIVQIKADAAAGYDTIKGAERLEDYEIMNAGLEWFLTNEPKAYMVLLD